MSDPKAKCPQCAWQERQEKDWNCLQCGQDIDLFDNLGRCEYCGFNHQKVYCPQEYGGCGESSALIDWYGNLDEGLAELDIFNL